VAKVNPQTLSEIPQKGVSLLVFGRTGVGKTMLLASGKDMVVLDTEGKPLTLQILKERGAANNILYHPTPKLQDVLDGMRWCMENNKNCALDSLTYFQGAWLEELLCDESRAPKSLKGKGSRELTTMQDYQRILIITIRAVKQIKALKAQGLDVVVTSHVTKRVPKYWEAEFNEAARKNPRDRDKLFESYSLLLPSLQGRIRDEIGLNFDAIGLMEKVTKGKKETYTLKFTCPYADVKNPGGRLPNAEIDGDSPDTLQRILARIKGLDNEENA